METDGSESLQELARKCRALARSASSPDVAATLNTMADDYERQAAAAAAAAVDEEQAAAPRPPNPA